MSRRTPTTQGRCAPTDAEPYHGSLDGYMNHRCRGDLCTRARTAHARTQRGADSDEGLPPWFDPLLREAAQL